MPALLRHYLEAHYGEKGKAAADALHAELYPLDINKEVDEGTYAVGLAIPAFGRTFRKNSARMIWPDEGAVAVPMMAFLRKDAQEGPRQVLEYLYSNEYQTYLSTTGLVCPVVSEAPPFEELKENDWRFLYSGWEAMTHVGRELAEGVNC
jgi:ABC-type Fe3+ transport system substrate-binding protein